MAVQVRQLVTTRPHGWVRVHGFKSGLTHHPVTGSPMPFLKKTRQPPVNETILYLITTAPVRHCRENDSPSLNGRRGCPDNR
jgi:hypothetical protein